MKLLLICFLCFCSKQAFAQKQSYVIRCYVYFDENSNGMREGYERGIGGVHFRVGEDFSAVSNEQGLVEFRIESEETILNLALDENSMPAGSRLTTYKEIAVYRTQGKYRDFEFGINYPEKVVRFEPKIKKMENTLSSFVAVRREGFSFFIQGDLWQAFEKHETLSGLQKLKIKTTKVPFSLLNLKELFDPLFSAHTELQKIEVGGDTLLKNEFRLKANEIGYRDIPVTTGEELSYVKYYFADFKEDCFLKLKKKFYRISDKQVQIISANEPGEILIICPGRLGQATFQPAKQWEVSFGMRPEENEYVDFIYPYHLRDSTDVREFFRIRTNADYLNIEDKKYQAVDGEIFFNRRGFRGPNEILISTPLKEKYKFKYTLFSGAWLEFHSRMQYMWKNSKTDSFDTGYKIEGVRQTAVDLAIYWHSFFGIIGNYERDLSETVIDNVDFTQTRLIHDRYSVHAAFRHAVFPDRYLSPEYTLRLGYGTRRFNPGQLAKTRFQDNFSGLQLRTDILFPEYIKQSMDLNIYGQTQITDNIFDGQSLLLGLETRFWLNETLGKILDIKPYFSRFNRYKWMQRPRLTMGLATEGSRAKTANAQNSFTQDTYLWAYMGLLIPLH